MRMVVLSVHNVAGQNVSNKKKGNSQMGKAISVLLIGLIFTTGCTSLYGENHSWNMRQSIARSAGDTAMTAMFNEGVNQEKAIQYVNSLIEFLESGSLNKSSISDAAYRIAQDVGLRDASDYISMLLSVIPKKINNHEQIPEEVRDVLLSFLRDGAIRASELYDNSKN
jgi:hypothetical protein